MRNIGSYIGIKRINNLQNICAILFCFSFDGHMKTFQNTTILHKSNNIMPPPRSRLQRSKEHSFMKLESSDFLARYFKKSGENAIIGGR